MLAGTCLGDQAALAHPLGQQGLPEGVVDFMGAGMGQVLPLQVNLGAAQLAAQATGVAQRVGRPT